MCMGGCSGSKTNSAPKKSGGANTSSSKSYKHNNVGKSANGATSGFGTPKVKMNLSGRRRG